MEKSAVFVLAERMLSLQADLLRSETGEMPPGSKDHFSLGYLWGFVDAHAQRAGISVGSDEFIFGILLVHEKVFGEEKGKSLLQQSVGLQGERNTEYFRGIEAGGGDVVSWYSSPGSDFKLGGEPGALAKDAKPIISGKEPRSWSQHCSVEASSAPGSGAGMGNAQEGVDLLAQCKEQHGLLLEAQYMAYIGSLAMKSLGEEISSEQKDTLESLKGVAKGLELAMYELAKVEGAPMLTMLLGFQSQPAVAAMIPGMKEDNEGSDLVRLCTTRNFWRMLWPDDPLPYRVAAGLEELEIELEEMSKRKAAEASPDLREQAFAPIKRSGKPAPQSSTTASGSSSSSGCLALIVAGVALSVGSCACVLC